MLRVIRTTAAIFVFVALSLFFLDFTESVPPAAIFLARIQFVPALSGALGGIAISGVILAILLIMTLLLGRVYCSAVCPLGILQDIIGWIARFRNRKKRYVFCSPFKKTRILFFLIAAVSLFAGMAGCLVGSSFLGFLDPYASFGRILTGIVSPFYDMGNNLLATIVRSQGSYSFYLVPVSVKSVFALTVAAVTLLLVGFLTWRWGRLYCNTVCPVGTFLGFLAKFSFFKIRINAERCVGCKLCEGACKGGCLDTAHKTVNTDRCVVCFDCLSACHKGAISYSAPGKKRLPVVEIQNSTKNDSGSPSNGAKSMTRIDSSKRRFLEGAVTLLATTGLSAFWTRRIFSQTSTDGPVTGNVAKGTNSSAPLKISDKGKTPYKLENAISPPGAVGLRHLAAHCTSCHLCVAQCPSDVIKPAFFDYGLGGIMLPVMKFSTEVFCNFDCTRCGDVCPTGAIRPLTMEEKHRTQIGRVIFTKENCIVFTEETNCGACAEHCPTQAVRMVDYKGNLTIPETREQYCVGCGACESICPVIPFKAIHIEGNPIHQTAEAPPQAEKIEVELDDFGF